MRMKCRAYSEKDGMEYIDDLYWFEENGVHEIVDSVGQGIYRKYIITWFIGFPDKNSKDIYGGDIIKFKAFRDYFYVITWRSGGYIGKNENEILLDLSVYRKEIEIIGNICENPKLLDNLINKGGTTCIR